MRNLKTTDIFTAARVVSAAKIADEVKVIANAMEENENVSIMDFGIEMTLGILEKLAGTESEKAIYKFLSGPLEIPEKEIADMDPMDLVDKLIEMTEVIDVERWKNFLSKLSKFVPKVG